MTFGFVTSPSRLRGGLRVRQWPGSGTGTFQAAALVGGAGSWGCSNWREGNSPGQLCACLCSDRMWNHPFPWMETRVLAVAQVRVGSTVPVPPLSPPCADTSPLTLAPAPFVPGVSCPLFMHLHPHLTLGSPGTSGRDLCYPLFSGVQRSPRTPRP